jgi:hypothetical protein
MLPFFSRGPWQRRPGEQATERTAPKIERWHLRGSPSRRHPIPDRSRPVADGGGRAFVRTAADRRTRHARAFVSAAARMLGA